MTAKDAVSLIKDGDTIVIATFYSVGAALDLIHALAEQGTRNLNIISNDPGLQGESTGILIRNGQVSSLTVTYVGTNPEAERLMTEGKLKVSLIPQGNLIEKLRATASGLGGFYTPTGVGTEVERGREKRTIHGREYLFEEAFCPRPKFAFVKAAKADRKGNLIFHGTARNFNPVVAMSAEITIVEAEEIVGAGEIPPDQVMLPFNYVDILVQSSGRKARPWLFRKSKSDEVDPGKERIARRIARELKDGDIVNLGIGIPTMVANFIPPGVTIDLQAENGLLGVGPSPRPGEEDPDVVGASGNPVTVIPGGAFFDTAMAFAMIRGGHIDVTVLGVLEVDGQGNLANYMIPGKRAPGIGGGMDLAVGAKKVIVATEHTTAEGHPKIVERCSLPLTASRVVDLIVTDLAVIEVTDQGLVLKELAPGKTVEEVRSLTGAKLIIAPDLKEMQF